MAVVRVLNIDMFRAGLAISQRYICPHTCQNPDMAEHSWLLSPSSCVHFALQNSTFKHRKRLSTMRIQGECTRAAAAYGILAAACVLLRTASMEFTPDAGLAVDCTRLKQQRCDATRQTGCVLSSRGEGTHVRGVFDCHRSPSSPSARRHSIPVWSVSLRYGVWYVNPLPAVVVDSFQHTYLQSRDDRSFWPISNLKGLWNAWQRHSKA